MKIFFAIMLILPFSSEAVVTLSSLSASARFHALRLGLQDGTGRCAGALQDSFNDCWEMGPDDRPRRVALGGGNYSGRREDVLSRFAQNNSDTERTPERVEPLLQETVISDPENIPPQSLPAPESQGSLTITGGSTPDNDQPEAPPEEASSPGETAHNHSHADRNGAPDSQSEPPAQTATQTPADAESPAEAPSEQPEAPAIVDQEELDDKFENFDAESCQWVEDMPRKIHEAPGCGRGRTTKICVGYVVCNRTQGEGKFIRASTCGEDNCSDAVACTKDRHFWSTPAAENDQKYLGRDIRNLINGASRQ